MSDSHRRARLYPLIFLIGVALLAACQADTTTETPEPTATLSPEAQVTPISGVAIVVTSSATLRAAPDVDAARLGNLAQNTVLELLGRSADGDWRLVRTEFAGGSTVEGWVGVEFLAFVTPTPTVVASDTPTNTPEAPDTPTPTNTPSGPDTPTPTNTPSGPDTPTPTNTPSGPDTPTPTNTPSGPDTPTPTNTPSGPDTPTPTNTPSGPSTPDPLQITVNVVWALDPNDVNQAIATVTISAWGGWEPYQYFRDDIQQPGPMFTYKWSTCSGNPVTFKVKSADGQEVKDERFEVPPCPTAMPDTPTFTATPGETAIPVAEGTPPSPYN